MIGDVERCSAAILRAQRRTQHRVRRLSGRGRTFGSRTKRLVTKREDLRSSRATDGACSLEGGAMLEERNLDAVRATLFPQEFLRSGSFGWTSPLLA